MRARTCRAVLPILLALACAPAAADAQVVHGTITDAETDEPVEGAALHLIGSSDQPVASVLSDSAGLFVLVAPAPGEYRVRAQRIGYATTTSTVVTVEPDARVEVTFKLPVQATILEPLTVVTERDRRTPGRVVNAERRARGLGVFLSRAELNAMELSDVREALRGIEGLELTYSPRRGRSGIQLQDGSFLYSSMGWGCMKIVINELPFPPAGFDIDEIVPYPVEVQAIEVYRTFEEVPEHHKFLVWPPRSLAPCGLVAIWTRTAW